MEGSTVNDVRVQSVNLQCSQIVRSFVSRYVEVATLLLFKSSPTCAAHALLMAGMPPLPEL